MTLEALFSPNRSERSLKCSMMTLLRSDNPGRLGLNPLSKSRICLKSQGLPIAPRPIITPSHPVSFLISMASDGSETSPLPITGILSCVLTSLMIFQSAFPENPWVTNHGWMVMASAPHSSMILAVSHAPGCPYDHPALIFTVRGTGQALRTAETISLTLSGVRSKAPPEPVLRTFLAGQPILISTISAPASTIVSAASAITWGS